MMNTGSDSIWKNVYDLTLSCGYATNLRDFGAEILSQINTYCNCDEATVYYIDGNFEIYDQYLINIDQRYSTFYINYYSKTDFGYFKGIESNRETPYDPQIVHINWREESKNEFVTNYIMQRDVNSTIGFFLHGIHGEPRTMIALSKKGYSFFNEKELLFFHALIPQLNNLHKKYFYQQNFNKKSQYVFDSFGLTNREKEVFDLLCKGVSPSNINKILCISMPTTYKHIQNIYSKTHVSSMQELLSRYNCG